MDDVQSRLFKACIVGRADEIAALAAAGADVNAIFMTGFPPLHIACVESNADMLTALVAAGANVNQADEDGGTALYIASTEGFAEAVTILCEAGAAAVAGEGTKRGWGEWEGKEEEAKSTVSGFRGNVGKSLRDIAETRGGGRGESYMHVHTMHRGLSTRPGWGGGRALIEAD